MSTKISDAARLTPPFDDTPLSLPTAKEGSDTAYRVEVSDLTLVPPAVSEVTLDGSGTVVLDPTTARVFALTTHGAGAAENVSIGRFSGSGLKPKYLGAEVVVYVKTLSDPADEVHVFSEGYSQVDVINTGQTLTTQTDTNGVVLYGSGDVSYGALFAYRSQYWAFDLLRSYSFNTDFADGGARLQPPNVTQDIKPQTTGLYGTGNSGTGAGGDLQIYGGDTASATELGGDVFISGGSNTLGHRGRVFMRHLPTVDPLEAGVLWNDSGTIKVSAGP